MKLLKIILPVVFALMIVVGSLLTALPVHAAPADAYWVAGNGNWTDATNHWATTDGGAPGAGNTPDNTSNVHFTASSNVAGGGASYTVTVNGAASCKDMDWANPTAGIPTLAGTFGINMAGSLTKVSGMTWTYSGTITFSATTSKTITNNGVVYAGALTFNGSGGTWQLQDDLNMGASTLTLTNGTLDTNGKTVTCGSFTVGAGTNTLTLGASVINTTGWTNVAGNTFTAGTSTINTTGGFTGGAKTYNNVTVTKASSFTTITDANTFANLTVANGAAADVEIRLAANQTVTGTLTMNGNSPSYRLLFWSNTLHTQRTISAGTVTGSNTILRDVNATGASSWNLSALTGIGNAGGNTGITFPTGINVYASQIPGNVNWSNPLNWATASNGTPGTGRVPLPQDIAAFDSSSIGVPGIIITFDVSNLSGINTLLVTNNPQFNGTTDYFYNSINLGTCIWNVTTDTYFYGQTAQTISGDFSSGGSNLRFDLQGGSFSQSGALTCGGTIYLTSGIWVTEGYAVTAKTFDSSTNTYNRALWLGNADSTLSSTFTLNGTASVNDQPVCGEPDE